jgi:hypothetical protein
LCGENKDALVAAINADHGSRSTHETLLALKFIPHWMPSSTPWATFKKWMKPQRRAVDLLNFFFGSNPWIL